MSGNAVDLSVLTPITSVTIPHAIPYDHLAKKMSEIMGVSADHLTFYSLVELVPEKGQGNISGKLACSIKDSAMTLEAIEALLIESRQMRTNLERTSASLVILNEELERNRSNPQPNSPTDKTRVTSLEREILRLKSELKESVKVRKESQRMLDTLRQEFQTLTKSILKSKHKRDRSSHHQQAGDDQQQQQQQQPEAPTSPVGARSPTNGIESPGSSGTFMPTTAWPSQTQMLDLNKVTKDTYVITIECSRMPTDDTSVCFRLVGRDLQSEIITMPFKKNSLVGKGDGGHFLFEFEFDAFSLATINGLSMWQELPSRSYPTYAERVQLRRKASSSGRALEAWPFELSQTSNAKYKKKIALFVRSKR